MKGARYHVPADGRSAEVGQTVDGVGGDGLRGDSPEGAEDLDLPLYLDIRRDLHMRLVAGEYTTGAAIPSEAKLAEWYRTTKLTVSAPFRWGRARATSCASRLGCPRSACAPGAFRGGPCRPRAPRSADSPCMYTARRDIHTTWPTSVERG